MTMIKQKIGKKFILVLAVAFVSYHVFATFVGIKSYADTLWGNKTTMAQETESSAYALKGGLTAQSGSNNQIELGLNTPSSKWANRIVIASQGMDLKLDGSMESQGSWNISETGGNFATNTAVPNSTSGNTVVFGHDRPGLFRNIHKLKAGDTIVIETAAERFVYSFSSFKVVKPTDISVMDQTVEPKLTLITCDGWLSQDRYIVTADLVDSSMK